jgi:hypothetical protein
MATSKLFGLARNASEYIRRRLSRSVQDAEVAEPRTLAAQRTSIGRRLANLVFGRRDDQEPQRPAASPPGSKRAERKAGAPPVQPPASPPRKPPPPRPPVGLSGDDDGDEDEIELLGRDAGYHLPKFASVMAGMRLTPGSSNVYGYYFDFESKQTGVLYVTFLAVGVGDKRSGPGQTYAYYNVSGRRYHEFARASDSSAGAAVWDYLRIRGTIAGHQYNYRLVQSHGDYVPRKATPRGFRTRNVTQIGVTGRREYRRSTLPERLFATPNRGTPDRGTPDRGDQ